MNIKEASKVIKVARSTLYNKIASGELSKTAGGKLEMSELLRVFGNPADRDKTQRQAQIDSIKKTLDTERDSEIKALKDQIKLLQDALEEARKREVWYMSKLDTLTDTVKLLETSKKDEQESKKGFFRRLFS